jgi:uncharacterized protein YoxC
MFSWVRFAIIGVIVAALSAVAIKVTMYLSEKDRMVQERDQQILNLKAEVTGLRLDNERLTQSNASLAADRDRKRDDLARVQTELTVLRATDMSSAKRLGELQLKLNDREHLEQMEQLRKSRRAELVLRVVNKSAKCEVDNFFKTDGACRNGEWVKKDERLVPLPSPTQPSAEAPPTEASR